MIKDFKLYLLDMDGTIYIDNQLIDGTIEFLSQIKASGGKYLFLTNNSSKSIDDYVKKLSSLGIKASKEDFYSSSMATSSYLLEHYPNKLVFCVGTKSFVLEMKLSGIKITEQIEDGIEVLLLAFDTELTSKKLRDLSYLLTTRDLAYIATNPDLVCPVDFGYIPDCGSISEMLYNATKKRPFFIGKPNPMMIENAMKLTGYSKEETVLIGDRLYTDIASGKNADIKTICVLTGEATLDDIEKSEVKPDYTFGSIKQLFKD